MQRLRIDAREQREIAGYHQPLDMMGVSLFAGLGDAGAHTGHFGVRTPVELRQRPVRLERIAGGVTGHAPPIDRAHIFAPTDDLADEPFGAVQRHAASPIFGFNRAAHRQRIKQPGVEINRHDGMVQELLPDQHRILISAEIAQAIAQELRKGSFGLGAGGGKPERLKLAEMVRKAGRDQLQHVARGLIGREPQGGGHGLNGCGWLAVIGIEVPRPASGMIAVHQQAGLAPHEPVEMLHPQAFAF